MFIKRNITKVMSIGNVKIGGNHSVKIQSMTNTNTADVKATVEQIHKLEEAGCEIIRVAVPNMEAAKAISDIKKQINIPLVADIHFDYRLALESIKNGVDKMRINPGNIGDIDRISAVVSAAKERNIPIRIGVNSGSLEKEILHKYGGVTAQGLFESAMKHVEILEGLDFKDIVISLKSHDVQLSLEAYGLLAEKTQYPLHIGITEAGTLYGGSIKSAVGIGGMLLNGIGDTLRVSLTSDPIEEIKCAKEILKSVGIREFGAKLISCPTCGRTEINLIKLAQDVEKELEKIDKPITVAVMGCVVNGPGEAREADIGLAGGKGQGIIFRKGKIIKKVDEANLLAEFLLELKKL